MKITLICCLTLTLISEYINRVSAGPVNPGYPGVVNGRHAIRGLNSLTAYRGYGYPRRLVRFLPVPIVKKVTHHHIHHVIAHKGVVKSKFSSEANNGFDLNNGDFNKNENPISFKEFKDSNDLRADFSDNGFKSDFNKRGGTTMKAPVANTFAQFANTGAVGQKSAISGLIGGQRAEFVPIVIGIIDDESGLTSDTDPNKEYSSRKGLLKPETNKKEYIPSKETIRLFEDLAKLGFK